MLTCSNFSSQLQERKKRVRLVHFGLTVFQTTEPSFLIYGKVWYWPYLCGFVPGSHIDVFLLILEDELVLEQFLILGPVPIVFHQAVFDNGTELVGESLMVPWAGLVTNSILFWWWLFLQSKISVLEVRFFQTHNQGLRQLFLKLSWILCT